VAAEEVGRADLNAGYLVNNTALVTEVLMKSASAAQQRAWIPEIADGTTVPAVCLTEPEHGSDAAAIEMRAERTSGGWLLTGEKTSITFGMHASKALTLARTSGSGARGITAFYAHLDSREVTRSPFRDLGGVAIGRASLHFDHLFVPDDHVVGEAGGGFTQVMQGFEFARAIIALICIGAASASIDEAMQHARDRQAFGQPISRFQAVAFPLVEHSTKLLAARLLALRALELKDLGLEHAVEANMVKWWAPRAALEAAHDALLVFGDSAYSDEYPLGQRIRDIIGLELGDGTANITKLVVARHLFGREYAP
jgi:cyclohexanecarboxyl-CoA dehydrogenase